MLITIFSTVAIFGLTEACMFFENASVIRVCAEQQHPKMGCGVEFPFSVNLTAVAGTAGKHGVSLLSSHYIEVCVCVYV